MITGIPHSDGKTSPGNAGLTYRRHNLLDKAIVTNGWQTRRIGVPEPLSEVRAVQLVLTPALTCILSHRRNDSVQPRMNTDEHGFSEMIFVVSLPLADSPIGDRFGFQQKVLFIRVHL
jgi:hypothetical protein